MQESELVMIQVPGNKSTSGIIQQQTKFNSNLCGTLITLGDRGM